MGFKSGQTHKHTELGEYAGWIKGDTINTGTSCDGAGVKGRAEDKLKKPRSESSCKGGRNGGRE